MGDLLFPLQVRLLRQTFLQIAAVSLLQLLLLLHDRDVLGLAFCAGFALLSLAAWASTSETSRPRSILIFGVLESIMLIAPWFMGGVRRPAAYFSLLLIHPLSLLLGMRAAWIFCGLFTADVVLLMQAEGHGLIVCTPPSPEMTMLMFTAMILYTLFFIASPLGQMRRLLAVADHHLLQRKESEGKLRELAAQLQERVGERTLELLARGESLQALARRNASELAPETVLLEDSVARLELAFEGEDSIRAKRSLDRIRRSCNRIGEMQSALDRFCQLGGASLNVGPLTAQEHRQLVAGVWEELGMARGLNVRFGLGELSGCQADPVLLRHVWQNLLSNAIKYSGRCSEPHVEVFSAGNGFCVRDNGIGFDPQRASNLFGLFQRLDNVHDIPGTGVGLAIVHRILELHGGSIKAVSALDQGATFSFSLSGAAAAVPEPVPESLQAA